MGRETEIDYSELTSYGEGEEASGPITGVKVYDGRGWYITVRLSDLHDSVITEHDYEDGKAPRRGLFIPFKDAGLTVTPKKNVLLVCKAEMAQVPSRRYTHLLTQILDRTIIESHRKLGFNHGFIGHARPMGQKPNNKKKLK